MAYSSDNYYKIFFSFLGNVLNEYSCVTLFVNFVDSIFQFLSLDCLIHIDVDTIIEKYSS